MRRSIAAAWLIASWACAATPSRSAEPVKVGVAIEMSGRFVEFGAHCRRGIDMAVDVLKAHPLNTPVDFIFRDVQSTAETTVSVFTELVSQSKLNYIIGPIASPLVSAAIPAWREGKPIWLVVGGSTTTVEKEAGSEPTFFHVYPYAYHYHQAIAGMLKHYLGGGKTVSIVYADDDYGRTHLPYAEHDLTEAGFKIISTDTVRANAADMNPVLTKVAYAKPDILVVLLQTNDAITIAKQAYIRRLKVPYLVGIAATQLKEFQDATGPAQEGWTGVTGYLPGLVDWPANPQYPDLLPSTRAWEDAFRARTHEEPQYDENLCYSTAMMLAIAIDRAGGDDRAKVAEELRKLDLDTPFGHAKFEPTEGGTKQNALSQTLVFQRQGGKSVVLFPAAIAKGTLQAVSRE
jgi:branched-chain amino acid transport system substrate-binding protein